MKKKINGTVNDEKLIFVDNKSSEIENYVQDEIDAQINEYNTLKSLEDHFETMIIEIDDFNFELASELKKRLKQLNSGEHHSDKSESSVKADKYESWIRILNQIDGFITSRELDVLDKCISTYASVCSCPFERRKEISRSLFLLKDWSGINYINPLDLEKKIYQIDVQILFELTEILIDLESLFYCSLNNYGIDLGDYECLCEDDLFQDTWLVAGKEYPNLIDYFFEAEVTDLFQDAGTVCWDYFSEHEYDNYAKYLCYQGELGFFYCSKENCEGCNHVHTKKVINPQYKLWEKYVEPLILP